MSNDDQYWFSNGGVVQSWTGLKKNPGSDHDFKILLVCDEPVMLLTAVWRTAFLELPSTATDCLQDLKGKFILLRYESKPLMGQVFNVVGDEVEVIYMQQLGGKNVFYLASFTWPPIPLQVWCAAHNIWARTFELVSFKTHDWK